MPSLGTLIAPPDGRAVPPPEVPIRYWYPLIAWPLAAGVPWLTVAELSCPVAAACTPVTLPGAPWERTGAEAGETGESPDPLVAKIVKV